MELNWSLYKGDNFLEPLSYSTGKDQKDLVEEILNEFRNNRVVFLKGMVGTGKSAVALNLVKELGRGVFSVPTKPLQDQYINDYEKELKILKNEEKPLEIKFLKGRNNFHCPYSEEADEDCSCFQCKGDDARANCQHLPCTVSIVDGELKDHVILKESSKVTEQDLREEENLSRLKVGELCPYWSPLYNFELKRQGFSSEKYSSVHGVSYWNKRENDPCPFYRQFRSYLDSDVIVYNSKMYEIETLYSERKPVVDVEIIDEADLFLDQLNMKTSIYKSTLEKIRDSIDSPGTKEQRYIEEVFFIFDEVIRENELNKFDNRVNNFLKALYFLLERIEDEWADNKQLKIEKTLKFSDNISYMGLMDDLEKISLFIPKPSQVLSDFISNSSDKILLMSATPHAKGVLKNVFGLEEMGYVEGETRIKGDLRVKRPSKSVKLTSKRFNKNKVKKDYYRALEECLEKSEKPCLLHIHAYRYLPEEIRKRAKKSQEQDIKEFKNGDRDILYSTKLKRGMDLRGDECRSVVIQKYPYPNLGDPYLQALKKRLGNEFWDYYEDMARRDLVQQIGRVLRSDDDWAEIWSPDKKVYNKLRGLRNLFNTS